MNKNSKTKMVIKDYNKVSHTLTSQKNHGVVLPG